MVFVRILCPALGGWTSDVVRSVDGTSVGLCLCCIDVGRREVRRTIGSVFSHTVRCRSRSRRRRGRVGSTGVCVGGQPPNPGSVSGIAAAAAAAATTGHLPTTAGTASILVAARAAEPTDIILVIGRAAVAVSTEYMTLERRTMLTLHDTLELTNVLECTLEDGGLAVLPVSASRDCLAQIFETRVDRLATLLL